MSNGVPHTPGLPLILDGNFFKVVAVDGLKVTGQCTLCPSRIMGLKTTTSNFNTHLKKMHPERHKVYEEYKIERGQTIKKRRLSHDSLTLSSSPSNGTLVRRRSSNIHNHPPSNSQSNGSSPTTTSNVLGSTSALFPHGGSMPGRGRPKVQVGEEGEESGINSTNNVREGGSLGSGPTMAPRQQMGSSGGVVRRRLGGGVYPQNRLSGGGNNRRGVLAHLGGISATSLPPNIKARKKETDDIVFNYVVQSLSPPSLVQTPYFNTLVSALCANPRRVMSTATLEGKISMKSLVKRSEIARTLSRASLVCITVDTWCLAQPFDPTLNNYLLLTAHWIGFNLKHSSALLSCRRTDKEMNYGTLVENLSEILGIYDLGNEKICCIVTNNASHILPTRIYDIRIGESNGEEDDNFEGESEISMSHNSLMSNEDLIFTSVSDLLSRPSERDIPLQLPSYYDCPTQTLLGVIANVSYDILSDPENEALTFLFQSTVLKCSALWKNCANKESGEKILEIYGTEIVIPNKYSWDSYLDSFNSLLLSKETLNELMSFCGIENFREEEIQFLEEYVRGMSPISRAFKVLHNPNDLYVGSLAPTILKLNKRLEELLEEELKYIRPLVEAIKNGLGEPFKDILALDIHARPLILASILHPFFKLRWIPEERVEELKSWYLEEAGNFSSILENLHGDDSCSSDEVGGNNSFKMNSSESDLFSLSEENGKNISGFLLEFIEYLEAPCEKIESQTFSKFPHVKKLFITFNTALASSVPVERLVNFGEVSYAPTRPLLKNDMFENMMILKCN